MDNVIKNEDRKYVSAEDFQRVYDLATKTKKSINAFIAYLRKSKRGSTKSP
jgi:hypothetical protein